MSKCSIGTQETTFVGYRITKYRMHADQDKTGAAAKWPTPENPVDLRRFLGLAGYYRRITKRSPISWPVVATTLGV